MLHLLNDLPLSVKAISEFIFQFMDKVVVEEYFLFEFLRVYWLEEVTSLSFLILSLHGFDLSKVFFDLAIRIHLNLFVASPIDRIVQLVFKEKVILDHTRGLIFEFLLLLQKFGMVLSLILVT